MKGKISTVSRTVLLVVVLALVATLLPACGPETIRVENPQDGGQINAFCAVKSKEVFGEPKGAYTESGRFGFVTGTVDGNTLFCRMSREGDPGGEVMLATNTSLKYVDPKNYPEYLQLKGVGVVETTITHLQANWEKYALGAVGIVTFVVVGNKVVGVVKGLRGASVADDAARVALEGGDDAARAVAEYGDDALRILATRAVEMGDEGVAALRGLIPQTDDIGHLATIAGFENADDLARMLGFENADDLARIFANNSDEAAQILGGTDDAARLADDLARLGNNQLSAVRVGHRSGAITRFARAEGRKLSWEALPVYETRFSHTSVKFLGFEMVRDTGSANLFYMAYPNVSLTGLVLAEGDDAVRGFFSMGSGTWVDDAANMADDGARVFHPIGAPVAAGVGDDVVRAAPELSYIRLPTLLGNAPLASGQTARAVAPGAESLNILRMMAGGVPEVAKDSMFLVPVK